MKKLDDAKRRQMILEGGIGKILIRLAVPTLMMSLVQSLIPLSDGLFINNVAGTLVASAVTFCNPVISLATSLAVGLSAAAMAVIGQTFGRGDFEEVRRVSTQTVVFGFLLGVCIIPVMILLAFPISAYVTPEISDNVRLYIILYAFVLPFSFMESIYNGIMNATGRPEKPFVRMVIMLVLKVAFNFVFIVWLRLGIVGCVLATFAANVAVCVWMFYELFLVSSSLQLSLAGFRFDRRIIRRLVKIGVPSMLTQMIMSLGFVLINNETQKYGAVVLNGQGIANSITSVCFNVPSAFGSAVTTMVSMNVGSGNTDRARKSAFRGCGLAVFLTDLIDKGKDLCSDLQVICVISSCCRPTFVNIGYRDRKTALFPVCRNYKNACSTGRLCDRDPIPGDLLYRKDFRIAGYQLKLRVRRIDQQAASCTRLQDVPLVAADGNRCSGRSSGGPLEVSGQCAV